LHDGWATVTVGDVANLHIERVPVKPGETYKIAGVLNAGQGMLERDPIDGSATNYPVLHRLRANQLVMRKLTAWEGPITVVPQDFDGYVVSTEFPTFTLDQAVLSPEYMRLVCQRPEFWEQMRDRSTGTVQRRKRVNPGQLLQITIDLPPLREQRRIVDLIRAVDDVAHAADKEALAALQLATSHETAVCRAGEQAEHITLGLVAEIAGGVTKDKKKEDGDNLVEVPYLRVANVQRGFIDLSTITTIKVPLSVVERLRLRHGDVLLNEGGDRDKLGRGWIWEDQLPECVHQNHVFRARIKDESFDSRFVSLWANSFGQQWFYENGGQTTGIASISMSTLNRFPLPRLPLSDQVEAVETSEAARSASARAQSLGKAARKLRAALLSQLLSGAAKVPEEYEKLLESLCSGSPSRRPFNVRLSNVLSRSDGRMCPAGISPGRATRFSLRRTSTARLCA
jgi:type I restriction enzyme, S subunit